QGARGGMENHSSATIATPPQEANARKTSLRVDESVQNDSDCHPNISATICTRANLAQYEEKPNPITATELPARTPRRSNCCATSVGHTVSNADPSELPRKTLIASAPFP